MKKFVIAIISVLVMLSAFSLGANAATYYSSNITSSIDSYLSGKIDTKCPSGTTCWVFSRNLSYHLFGDITFPSGTGGLYYLTNKGNDYNQVGQVVNCSTSSVVSLLKQALPGDVIQYKSSYTNPQHTCIVKNVTDSEITICEAITTDGVYYYRIRTIALTTTGVESWNSSNPSRCGFGKFNSSGYGMTIYRYKNVEKAPEYTSIPDPVTNLKSNKEVYNSSESITFTWDAAYGAETYWVYLWKDGVQLFALNCGNNTSFTQAPSSPGNYTLYIRPGNSNGFNESSNSCSFIVTNDVPKPVVKISSNKEIYNSSEYINFNWEPVYGAQTYWVYLWKDGVQLYAYECGNKTSFIQGPSASGKYTLIIRPGNMNGFNDASKSCTYIVTNDVPANVENLRSEKSLYTTSESINFTWDVAYGAEAYWVYLWKDGVELYSYNCGNDTSFTQAPSSEGKYTLVIRPANLNGFNNTSNSYSFVVNNGYLITYDLDYSYINDQTKTYNTEIQLNVTIPTRTGYVFKYWNTSSDGSGVSYNPGDTYAENADLTLYAIWERDTFALENSSLNVDTEKGIVYGADLFGISQTDIESQFSNENMTVIMANDSRMSTGTVLQLIDSDNIVYDTLTVVIFGDVNGDGWYDGEDAFMVNLIAKGLLDETDVGAAIWAAADCNHDGVIDEADVDLLSNAGLLLNDVDQSASQAELAANAAYIEYIGLIDQSFDINADNSANTSENADVADTIVENGPDRSETEADNGEDNADEFNFEAVIIDILSFIKKIFSFIFLLIVD